MLPIELILHGMSIALSPSILPYLPCLVLFNFVDRLGERRIFTRILFFAVGVSFSFLFSVYMLSLFPYFFIANATKLDIFWASLILLIGYMVFKKKTVLIQRVARDMLSMWYLGTFYMGSFFGAVWVNYLTINDIEASRIFSSATFSTNLARDMMETTFYVLGIIATIVVASLITYYLAKIADDDLTKRRRMVKIVCGFVIVAFATYIIFTDLRMILLY